MSIVTYRDTYIHAEPNVQAASWPAVHLPLSRRSPAAAPAAAPPAAAAAAGVWVELEPPQALLHGRHLLVTRTAGG